MNGRRRSWFAVLCLLAGPGCGSERGATRVASEGGRLPVAGAAPGSYGDGRDLGYVLTSEQGLLEVRAPTVGRSAPTLHGVRALREPAHVLFGPTRPGGVLSPDGSVLAYNSWHWLTDPARLGTDAPPSDLHPGDEVGIPSIRFTDLRTGESDVVTGAQTVAWGAPGLAYAAGVRPAHRVDGPYLSIVVYRSRPDAPPETLLPSPANYLVEAWAGPELLVTSVDPEREADGRLLAVGRNGSVRTLLPSARFLALDRVGRRVLAITPDHPLVVVDVETATVLASISPRPGGHPSIIAALWRSDGEIITLQADGSRASLQSYELVSGRLHPVAGPTAMPGRFPTAHALALTPTGEPVVLLSDDSTVALAPCPAAADACVAFDTGLPYRSFVAPLQNPSRPLKGGR